MATTTPNFGWAVPTSTDLVKDGAVAIETLGDSIDASLVDLKGGTTGQVLAKASGTDMDFSWVAQDDSNAIQNAIVDAKGDLIAASANDTPARLAVGANGETLVADSSTSTGLRYTAGTVQANPVLNSAFQVWQRGTTITANNGYSADRWFYYSTNNNATVSRQATGDTTNLPNIQYCARVQRNSGSTGTGDITFTQSMESINSIPFAGKTITLSFYARVGANYSGGTSFISQVRSGTGTDQNLLSGYTGSSSFISNTQALTTTWTRYSYTGTVATTATEIGIYTGFTPSGTAGANDWYEITGVQIDVGNVALPFRTNGATLQGELAACQRYYWRTTGQQYTPYATGMSTTATDGTLYVQYPVPMRAVPSSVEFANLAISDLFAYSLAVTTLAFDAGSVGTNLARINVGNATGATTFRPAFLRNNNNTSGYLGMSAEL
jgi:hypothetical protein